MISLKTLYLFHSIHLGYAGVAILSKTEPVNVITGIQSSSCVEGRALTLEFESFFVVGTYVPNSGQDLQFASKRANWDSKIKTHLSSLKAQNKHVIWGGDLNVAMLDYDVYDGDTNAQRSVYLSF